MKKPKQSIIADVPSFLESIYSLSPPESVRCFRGEANCMWPLKPSIMRGLEVDAERNIISELTLEAPDDFDRDTSMFRKLVRAQHYSLPTRLLDVSLNPLVALFFACSDEKEIKNDAHVIVMDFDVNRVKFADSDAVSILCNIANLSDTERSNIDVCIKKCKRAGISVDKIKEEINNLDEVDRLVQFVKIEKPYFRKAVIPTDFKRYYFVYPHKNNKRLVAQSGAFVVAGLLDYKNTDNASSFSINKMLIKANHKENILRQLDQININNRTMFPEIEFASRYIKRRWTKKKASDYGLTELLGGGIFD